MVTIRFNILFRLKKPVVLSVLDKHKNHSHCIALNLAVPILSNLKMNVCPKYIADV